MSDRMTQRPTPREARRAGDCGCGGACGSEGPAAGEPTAGTSRRDFLKVLGVGGAGAAAAACGPPDYADTLIPYLVQEEEIVPGVSERYATVLPEAGPEPLPVHADVRDGRVLMIEGNPDFPTTAGRISALGQSALQDLYDPDRVRNPLQRTGEPADGDPASAFADAPWDEAIAAVGAAVGRGGTVLLTGAVTGTAARFYEEWATAMGAEHVQYEPFEYAALRQAHGLVFGRAAIPRYDLAAADRVACFGADFLGTWLAPVELAAGFAAARAIEQGRHAKFTFIGPRRSLTASNADEWMRARAGTEGSLALAVANVVADGRGVALPEAAREFTPESVAGPAGVNAGAIRALGEELAAAESPIALPPGVEAQGPDALQTHAAVALLNRVLGAVGRTVHLEGGPQRGESATYAEMRRLIGRLSGGDVRTLIVAGANPAFSLPAASGFGQAVADVDLIAISPHLDETAARATWVLPSHHALEAWGDAEPRPGVWALGQPLMRPLFDTRQREDILIQLAGVAGVADALGAPDYATYLRNAWAARTGGGEAAWLDALRRGGVYGGGMGGDGADAEPTGEAGGGATGGAAAVTGQPAPGDLSRLSFARPGEPRGTSLVLYPTVQFYDGRGANRSWMQEMPDPVTRAVWGSWVEVHPDRAEELGVRQGDVVEVRTEAGAIEAPVYVHRGIRPDTVAIPIGQGHTAYGRAARGRGVNPLDLLPATADPGSGALAFAGTTVTVSPTGRRQRLVTTQGSDTDLGREVAELLNVEEARSAIREHEVDIVELLDAAWDSDPDSPYRWGMTIDLNACTGCGACVTSCYAENNIPTVGEDLVAQRREMSWLRVHRFHEETADGDFRTVHQPMLCQHCGDAPCEPVCPVYATYHNGEGLNVQVYNRCVGTRYCSNNCPYKVRRFNWFEYEFPYPLNLQLSPDVTVREKGVMEKCTFCVQRINRAKMRAKEEGRFVEDGEITTACQASCPTRAITFGNLKDPTSRVSRIARSARAYGALAELGTRPAVTYLDDVTHAELARAEHDGAEGDHGEAGASAEETH